MLGSGRRPGQCVPGASPEWWCWVRSRPRSDRSGGGRFGKHATPTGPVWRRWVRTPDRAHPPSETRRPHRNDGDVPSTGRRLPPNTRGKSLIATRLPRSPISSAGLTRDEPLTAAREIRSNPIPFCLECSSTNLRARRISCSLEPIKSRLKFDSGDVNARNAVRNRGPETSPRV